MEASIRDATQTALPNQRRTTPWVNKECYAKGRETMAALHDVRRSADERNLKKYAEKKKEYKQMMKQAK